MLKTHLFLCHSRYCQCHDVVRNVVCFSTIQQSSSSRPPAVRYIIQYYKDDDDYGYYDHDEVDDDDVFQMTANLTYIVIKVVPGRWYVKVAAVNVLGPSLYNKRYWPPYSRSEFNSCDGMKLMQFSILQMVIDHNDSTTRPVTRSATENECKLYNQCIKLSYIPSSVMLIRAWYIPSTVLFSSLMPITETLYSTP